MSPSRRPARAGGRSRWLLALFLTLALILPLGPLAPALDAAVAGEGRGVSWGDNDHGQLGDFKGGTDSHIPVSVWENARFVVVSAGA